MSTNLVEKYGNVLPDVLPDIHLNVGLTQLMGAGDLWRVMGTIKLVRAKCVRCPWALQVEQSVHYLRCYFLFFLSTIMKDFGPNVSGKIKHS